MDRLRNKVALITGGGGGIGREASRRFADEGAVVAIMDIDDTHGHEAESEIKVKGHEALYVHTDVSSATDVENAVGRIKKEYGRVDILYNNASILLTHKDNRIDKIEEEVWDRTVDVNLKSIFLLCQYCIPLMLENGGGSIINTSSSCGLIGIPGSDAYSATKGATIALTRSLAVELGPYNIRVNLYRTCGHRDTNARVLGSARF